MAVIGRCKEEGRLSAVMREELTDGNLLVRRDLNNEQGIDEAAN